MRSFPNRFGIALLILGIALHLSPATLAEALPSSVLTGTVHTTGTNAPVTGVSVVAYHLSSEKTFTAPATDGTGRFRLPGLPQGYFDIAVRTPEGLFVGNQVVNVSAEKTADVSIGLSADTLASSGGGRERFFAGQNEPTSGEALIGSNQGKGGFWTSPAGVSVAAGAGLVTLLAIGGGSSSSSASPFVP